MSKKVTLKRFFQSHFPLCLDPQYLLFNNRKTGSLDIVGRSGVILCSVPVIPGRGYKTQKALAGEIIACLDDGLFGIDYPVSSKLCCWDKCLEYDNETDYDSPVDFCKIIYPYNPDHYL